MSDLFYEEVKPIDALKDIRLPSKPDVEKLLKLLTEDIFHKYFFHDLENPNWIPLLHEIDFFLNPPGLIEIGEGRFQQPIWHAGHYLMNYSVQYPNIIVDIAQNLVTNNARAYSNIIKSLTQLEPNDAVKAVSSASNWLECPFGDLLLHDVKRYLNLLVNNQYYEEALIMIAGLLKPTIQGADVPRSQVELRYVKVRPDYDDYWLKDIIRVHLPKLTKEIPIKILTVLEQNLVQTFELEKSLLDDEESIGRASYWRSAIEDHLQNTSFDAYKDLLVDGIRDSLIEVCNKNKALGSEYISGYLSKDYSIFGRIALFLLRLNGKNYTDILSDVFADQMILDDSSVHHELYHLLKDQFLTLQEKERNQIIKWLFEGPADKESISKWIVETEDPEKPDEELRKYYDYWTLRRMWAIRNYLVGEDKQRFEKLVNEYGEPDHPDFLAWSSGFHGIDRTSPISQPEMLELSMQNIIQELKSYTPPSKSVQFSRENLAETLNSAVAEKPRHFTDLSRYLIDKDIRFIYTYHYLTGIKTAITRDEDIKLDPILDLCDYVVSEQIDPFESDEWHHEPGLKAAQFLVTNLIETILEKGRNDLLQLDEEEVQRIQTIIDILLQNPNPDLEDDLESSWDAATRSLNCIRGSAMHDLIHLARYLDKKAKQEKEDSEHKPEIDPFVMSRLEEKFDKSLDPSPAVHSVFGWYTPLLEYLDHEWLVAHIPQIFPEDPNYDAFWLAAWDAYVSFNQVYSRVFKLLIPQYHHAVFLLDNPDDSERIGTTKGERLAEHLTYAYIYELIDIDSEDGLYKSFYEKAEEKLRSHVAFWLVKAFGELNLNEDDPIWNRMWKLWEWRFEEAFYNKFDTHEEEISNYMRWLKHIPLGFEIVEPYLKTTVPFLKEGYHKTLVIDYLVENCGHYPYQTVEILHLLIKASKAEWFSISEENAGIILENAINSGNDDAISEAILLINLFGEREDFRWKEYLPDQKAE